MGEANNGKKSQKLAKILGTASATHLEAFLMPGIFARERSTANYERLTRRIASATGFRRFLHWLLPNM